MTVDLRSPAPGTTAPTRCALGLGSNIGDTLVHLYKAVAALNASDGITVVARSSDYRTAPWGPVAQDDFHNICVLVDATLQPQDLLERCLAIEAEIGRVRDVRWGPRVIDIDVLIYGMQRINEPDLELPHPRMAERAFVLIPLAEVWPDAPLANGETAAEALMTCPDQESVVKLASPMG